MYHTILFLLYLPLKIVHASGNSSYEEFAANCTSMQQSHDPMKNCGSLSFPGKRCEPVPWAGFRCEESLPLLTRFFSGPSIDRIWRFLDCRCRVVDWSGIEGTERFDAEKVYGSPLTLEGPTIIGDSLFWSDHNEGVMCQNLTTKEISTYVSMGDVPDMIPHCIAHDPTTDTIIVTSENPGNGNVYRIDKEKNVVNLTPDIKLNAPNGVSTRSDGIIYFVDPYFIHFRKPPVNLKVGLYSIIDGVVKLEYDFVPQYGLMATPNGLVISKDETRLYVATTSPAIMVEFEVDETGHIKWLRDIPDPLDLLLLPDGITLFKDRLVVATGRDYLEFRSLDTPTSTYALELLRTGLFKTLDVEVDERDDTFYVTEAITVHGPFSLWKLSPKQSHKGFNYPNPDIIMKTIDASSEGHNTLPSVETMHNFDARTDTTDL